MINTLLHLLMLHVLAMSLTAQSALEAEILKVSQDKLTWKNTGQYDRLAELFDDALVLIHITGQVTTKADWMTQRRTGRFVNVLSKKKPQ